MMNTELVGDQKGGENPQFWQQPWGVYLHVTLPACSFQERSKWHQLGWRMGQAKTLQGNATEGKLHLQKLSCQGGELPAGGEKGKNLTSEEPLSKAAPTRPP